MKRYGVTTSKQPMLITKLPKSSCNKKTPQTDSGFFLAAHYKGCKVTSRPKTVKWLVGILSIVCFLLGSISINAQQVGEGGSDPDQKFYISIPPLNAAEALNRLAKQTGAQLLFSYEFALTKNANPVVGHYRVMDALTQLLEGSGLESSLSNKGAITISDFGKVTQQNQREREAMNLNNLKYKKRMLAGLTAVFVGSGIGANSFAVENGEGNNLSIDEVIVTAQKRDQRLIDVPISIEALSEETVKEFGITGLNDLSRVVPNVSIRSLSDSDHTITIRGVGNTAGNSALSGIYLDEIPLSISSQLQADLQPIDVQRLEVLRGPQGTLYGQGSTFAGV